MSDDATVNAGDIARLAGVGRAAVSNWRRRYEDFPRPVGGTSSSPLFSLVEVEAWLRRNGKSYDVSRGDRVWQRLRAHSDDLRLGELIAWVGAFLLYLGRDHAGWRRLARARDLMDRLPGAVETASADLPGKLGPPLRDAALVRSIADLAEEDGPASVFEFLCERYVETHSRRLFVTRAEVAALMVRLARPDAGTVLDPACGIGGLLLSAELPPDRLPPDRLPPDRLPPDRLPAHRLPAGRLPGDELPGDKAPGDKAPGDRGARAGLRLLGQEISETSAQIAAVRLLLLGAGTRIVAGDSLRQDGFPEERADAVVCDPPFNERAWGYEDLTGDPRWEYGLPPRGESELAWVQHCLARVKPGGTVAILMPAAAAARRPGKRIRANLLRAGSLRAVITLAAGGPDLWLLRRPDGERPSSQVLIADATDDLSIAEAAWQAHSSDAEAELPPGSRTVRIIDLLDDEVDLSPSRHRPHQGGADLGPAFAIARDRFAQVAATLVARLPGVDVLGEQSDLPMTTVGELVKAGLVAIHYASVKMTTDEGEVTVLTAEDVAAGTPPSGRTGFEPGLVTVEPQDVVTTIITGNGTARVISDGGAVLGPQLSLYRVDQERIDPFFLAGFLRFAGGTTTPRGHSGSSRADGRRARIPRLSLAEQQAYGQVFRELVTLEDTLRETVAFGETLVRLGFDGLAVGLLRPRS